MAEVKWVKLTTDMFDNRKIKHIRRLSEGNNIVLIWVILLTMAGRCNSGGMIFLTENIPYTAAMLADELGFEESTVMLALKSLEQLSMIVVDEGYFSIAGWEEYQNIEGMEKIRESKRLAQARWRAKQKELPSTVDSTVDSTEISQRVSVDYAEEDIEIDKDIYTPIAPKVDKDFDVFWKAYPKKVGKGAAKKAFKKVKVPVETLVSAIKRQERSEQWMKDGGQFIPYPSTWLNQERWEDEIGTSTTEEVDIYAGLV
jgi:predicted phage replisome organizer